MKACPSCGRLYPQDASFCPVDGANLGSATQVPIVPDGGDSRVGQLLLERYEIRRVVADGGMGRVYEALDLVERRNVAIKILHAEIARDPVQVERFKREFQVSRQLSHSHIVEVIDFTDLKDGSYALVMEYLFGEELRQALDRERYLPPARIVRMISQVALGLDPAHKNHLVHRDLKPDNVFLCQTPEGDIIKLLDFGSVKDKAEGAKKLTVMGTTIGSPYYMSPEQAQGLDTLDHRADIWALGAILFECMAGQVPFAGVNGPQILLSILTKEAPPLSTIEDKQYPIPVGMDLVLAKAFKRTASLRHETVGALANAVGEAFGLQGEHQKWANLTEATLSEQIEERLGALMSISPPKEGKKSAQDGFFGDNDSLGEVGVDSMTEAMQAADVSLSQQESRRAAEVGVGLPENLSIAGLKVGQSLPPGALIGIGIVLLALLLFLIF